MHYSESLRCKFFCDRIVPIVRIWGFFTSIVYFCVGAGLQVREQDLAGGMAIAGSLITFFLETTWFTTILLNIWLRNESHRIFVLWNAVLWVDTWKKMIVYTLFSVILYTTAHGLHGFPIAASFMLMLLGIFHLALIQHKRMNSDVCLLEDQDGDRDHEGYSQAVMDDEEVDLTIPEPIIDQDLGTLDINNHQFEDDRTSDDICVLRNIP